MKAGMPGGSVLAAVLAVGSFAMVFVRAFGERGDGWADVLELLPLLGGAVVVGVAMIGGFSGYERARLRYLQKQFPDAVIFTAEMTPALKQLLRSRSAERANADPAGLPHFFTAVASNEGLSFWRGWGTRSVMFWQIDWSSILELRPEEIQLQFKTVHGIRAHTGASAGALQLAPYPHSFFSDPHSFVSGSWDRADVEALVAALREKSSNLAI